MTRAGPVLGVALLFAALPAPALARPVCGPAKADTLGRSEQARVYTGGGEVFGCHRAGRDAARRLGALDAVLSVQVAGRYAAVERRGAGAPGERLSLYDLRRGRRTHDVRHDRGLQRGGQFTRIRLDASGIAAFISDLPADGHRPARIEVSTTEDANLPLNISGPDIGKRTLGFAGSTVAWRRGPDLEFSQLAEHSTAPGKLLRFEGLRIDAGGRGLVLRPAGRRAIAVGSAQGVCESASGCSGVDALRRAGRYVAIRSRLSDASGTDGALELADLETGTFRVVYDPVALPYAGMYSFVVVESGATAFVVREAAKHDPTVQQQAVTRVRTSAGEILDEGGGIELDSLRRRGDRLVWRHDGKRRSAPLPR